MEKDTLDELFDNLKGEFDINEPNAGHQDRFLEKLNTNTVASTEEKKSSGFNWKPFLAIAAFFSDLLSCIYNIKCSARSYGFSKCVTRNV
ncbi:hypothetical protein [Winogradskyella poriferorum]|uniref:Uncharacterized protein n=1 Tax=Winogradskyella poriferorum TaxID=307627 RepID=A0ABU7W6X9_9FLAO